jgi:hypothetical protein
MRHDEKFGKKIAVFFQQAGNGIFRWHDQGDGGIQRLPQFARGTVRLDGFVHLTPNSE